MKRSSRNKKYAGGTKFHGIEGVTCLKAQKRCYETRAAAKRARNMYDSGMSVYPCDGHYHIGHHGDYSREEHREYHG